MKPKLLVVELWGLGDLVIATPFLQAASQKYDVTLLAKPYAKDLQARFWTNVRVLPFVAPWTAFVHKYRLFAWPWRQVWRLLRQLKDEQFEYGLSARLGDPRDHLLLQLADVKARLGFPRLGSDWFLTQPLLSPDPTLHRYEYWRVLARALGFELPQRERLLLPLRRPGSEILVHTGAGQSVRVWPLERYRLLVGKLRQADYRVRVACDPDQLEWWEEAGEQRPAMPHTAAELFALVDRAGVFIGNDSGPGHLAAFCGVPTFTIFGPQLPEWFSPLNPASEWVEGKACPYKPCKDYCRFALPLCTVNSSEEEVWNRVSRFVQKNMKNGAPSRRAV